MTISDINKAIADNPEMSMGNTMLDDKAVFTMKGEIARLQNLAKIDLQKYTTIVSEE